MEQMYDDLFNIINIIIICHYASCGLCTIHLVSKDFHGSFFYFFFFFFQGNLDISDLIKSEQGNFNPVLCIFVRNTKH